MTNDRRSRLGMSAKIFTFLIVINIARAAPPPFSCLSYAEDDRIYLEDEYSDETSDISPKFEASGLTSQELKAEADDKRNATPYIRVCPADYTFCFSLWKKTENGAKIEKQGCWKESTEGHATCNNLDCVSSSPTSKNNSMYYCCCSGYACNGNVSIVELSYLELSKADYADTATFANPRAALQWSTTYLWFAVLGLCFLITVSSGFIYCRTIREKPEPEEAPLSPSGPGYSSNLRNVDNLNLISMLGCGKYGTVMKGLLNDQEVAVKIFPQAHQQYFINEKNIYSLPLMDCPALLTYFGYDERQTLEGKAEYHLVLSLAPLGCLQDYLIANTLNFEEFCGMVKTITRGLSHLHTELRRGDEYKPCVAHRDLNTRNILVKSDRTCCIADFGFALKVFGPRYEYKGEIAEAETKSINEVGTLRYMAPELLEGAVNLRDCETSLKQMDVYSLGLVLWEVSTRCSDFYPQGQVTPPYKAPYELEVGTHPNFDQMQSLVVRHKARPLFPNGWGGLGAAAKLVRDTCEDCWDTDAEARLTSLCTEERMHEVSSLGVRYNANLAATTPVINTNNLNNAITEAAELKPRTPNQIDNINSETNTILNPPPNQKVIPYSQTDVVDGSFQNNCSLNAEKNHLICNQTQIQPYQGRNPCQERNLAPLIARSPQKLIERSKKHSFQTNSAEESSLSCLDEDVSVEELITGRSFKKFPSLEQEEVSALGQGFPKRQNIDRTLKGWHGVRAIIQKRLFRKMDGTGVEVFRQLNGGDEKSNLVEKTAGDKGTINTNPIIISFIENEKCTKNDNEKSAVCITAADLPISGHIIIKRPNNLDLSPLAVNANGFKISPPSIQPANYITTIDEEEHTEQDVAVVEAGRSVAEQRPKCTDRSATLPAQNVIRSRSSNLLRSAGDAANNNNNSNYHEGSLKLMSSLENSVKMRQYSTSEPQFRRQRSLEVFREVFNARASNERLRDPSQRVKTPGDVPPSVRKIRASKTLSLYDDRMMDPTTLNIL